MRGAGTDVGEAALDVAARRQQRATIRAAAYWAWRNASVPSLGQRLQPAAVALPRRRGDRRAPRQRPRRRAERRRRRGAAGAGRPECADRDRPAPPAADAGVAVHRLHDRGADRRGRHRRRRRRAAGRRGHRRHRLPERHHRLRPGIPRRTRDGGAEEDGQPAGARDPRRPVRHHRGDASGARRPGGTGSRQHPAGRPAADRAVRAEGRRIGAHRRITAGRQADRAPWRAPTCRSATGSTWPSRARS